MAHRTVITGQSAEVRWGYHRAASVGPWTITSELAPEGGVTRVEATVQAQDEVRLSQRPLTFVVPRPAGNWHWPILSLQNAGGTLTAVLGSQE